eukprot:scaffold2536_cov169-Amphora_coffeaeformis.AAC.9
MMGCTNNIDNIQQRKRRKSRIHENTRSVCWIAYALAVYSCVNAADAFATRTRAQSRYDGRTRPALNEASRGLPISFPNSNRDKSQATQSLPRTPRVIVRRPTKQEATTGLPDSPDSVFFPFFPSTPAAAKDGDDENMSMSQMIVMNAVGGAMTVGVLYALASTDLNSLLSGAGPEDLEKVGFTIADAALPMSATDIVTVSFSEAVSAVIAAAVSLCFSLLLRATSRRKKDRKQRVEDIQKAVGNGDFLLAQATALPLLESLGLPPFVAATVCVVFAAVPAEIVKIAGRRKIDRLAAEDELFEYLLQREKEREQKKFPFSFFPAKQDSLPLPEMMAEWQKTADQMARVQKEALVVDIVADIIKWLGYSVLCNDLRGQIVYNGLPLFPGVESAAFGIMASLSAQVYADILYAYFGFGGEEKQEEVRSRTLISWACTYFTEAAYAGIFFGIYEFAQIPAMASVSAFLSGGAEACYGSQDFDVCLQTFESLNPPGASPEAQFRSLITTLASIWNRYSPDSFVSSG